jgi:hypothetical protein
MPAPDAKPPHPLEAALDAMAKAVGGLHRSENTGALAALRRLDVDRPLAPDFHALLAEAVPDHLFSGDSTLDAMTRRFARVAQIMAMKPGDLGGRSLGDVFQAVFHPNRNRRSQSARNRLAMLLNARGPTLDDLARRVARRIAQSDEPMPYRDLGRLLLDERGDKRGDELRLRIARDFQRALHKKDAEDKTDKKD